jgi:hypothetical protein
MVAAFMHNWWSGKIKGWFARQCKKPHKSISLGGTVIFSYYIKMTPLNKTDNCRVIMNL